MNDQGTVKTPFLAIRDDIVGPGKHSFWIIRISGRLKA
jgi:hypothetical protein